MSIAIRAVIPAGLMPSAEHPFALQLCPAYFPALSSRTMSGMQMQHGSHDHAMSHGTSDPAPAGHHDHRSSVEHCPFAASALLGPVAFIALLNPTTDIVLLLQAQRPAQVRALQRLQGHQARAPPSLI